MYWVLPQLRKKKKNKPVKHSIDYDHINLTSKRDKQPALYSKRNKSLESGRLSLLLFFIFKIIEFQNNKDDFQIMLSLVTKSNFFSLIYLKDLNCNMTSNNSWCSRRCSINKISTTQKKNKGKHLKKAATTTCTLTQLWQIIDKMPEHAHPLVVLLRMKMFSNRVQKNKMPCGAIT